MSGLRADEAAAIDRLIGAYLDARLPPASRYDRVTVTAVDRDNRVAPATTASGEAVVCAYFGPAPVSGMSYWAFRRAGGAYRLAERAR